MGSRRNVQRRLNVLWGHTIGAAVLVLIGIGLLYAALFLSADPAWPIALAIGSITLGLSVLISTVREVSALALDAATWTPRFDMELRTSGETPEWLTEQRASRKQQRGTE